MSDADPHLKDRLLNDLSSSIDSRQNEPLAEAPGAPPAIPDHILLRRIGKGSYGEVWLARNVMGTFRAVKIVYRRAFDSDRPYEREFAGIRRFEPVSRTHPSQLNVLHVGRDDAAGYFYYVMELADPVTPVFQPAGAKGERGVAETGPPTGKSALQPDTYSPRTLRSELHQRGALPHEECLSVATALATALDHLHRNSLVHRDIKPSNIIFVNGIPKLADIGLVTHLEATLSFVGTEGFIPPEGPGTPRADIYSLGKVLYEMVTGRDRQEFPELPTNLAARPMRERVALEELNEVVVRACHADPKQRYATAAEMHAELALLQSGKSVTRMHRLERHLKFLARAGAAVTALAAVVALGWFWQIRQTRTVRELAEDNAALARQSHQRLVQAHTGNGLRAMEEDDPAAAALWFAEVLKFSEGDVDLARRQRDRLGMLLGTQAKPVALSSIEGERARFVLAADGKRIIASFRHVWDGLGAGEVRVLDASSMQLLRSATISNLWGAPHPSPGGKWAVVSEEGRERIWDLETGGPLPCEFQVAGAAGISSWSDDETRLALVKQEGMDVQLIEVPSGRLLVPPLHHNHPVVGLSLDPSGRWLATGTKIKRERSPSNPDDEVGQARLWDARTGEPVTDWIELEDPANNLVFNRDGSAIAIFSSVHYGAVSRQELNLVRVVSRSSGSLRFPPLDHSDRVVSVAFSPDGRYLAAGGADSVVTVWDALTGEPVHPALNHRNTSYTLAFSPDSAWLAAGGEAGVRVWNMRSGSLALPDLRLEQRVDQFQFTPEGGELFALSRSGLLRRYDLKTVGAMLSPILGDEHVPIGSVIFSPNGRKFATVGGTGDLRLWDARSLMSEGPALAPNRGTEVTVGSLQNRASWSPDGRWLAVPSGDKTARIWDVTTGKESAVRLRHAGLVNSVEFSPDGTKIATAGDDGTARVWDPLNGNELAPPLQHKARVIKATFSPDGRWIATASYDGTARVWEAATGAPVSPPMEHGGQVTEVRFSPDGSRLGMSGNRAWATVRDAVSGKQIGATLQHANTIIRVLFSPDGRRILTTSMDRTARIWNAETGEPVSPPMKHEDYVVSSGFSPDGLRVVTGSLDQTARLWDAATGEPLGPPFRHGQGVLSVTVSPDGSRVCTSCLDGTVRFWGISPPDWTDAEFGAAARLLAAAGIGLSEQFEPMERNQIEVAWRQIRPRFEQTTEDSRTASIHWHQRRLAFFEGSQEWFGAEFHARRLTALQPGDTAARTDLERILAVRPPPRDPATPPELIDLSPFYNASLALPWHPGPAGNHLADLPRGVQTLGGTVFDVRGLVQVQLGKTSRNLQERYPSQVKGIPIGRHLNRLQILHSIQGGQQPVGTRVGHYTIHFSNGRQEQIPILYGRDARDWHEHPDAPVDATDAVIVWKGWTPACKEVGTRGTRLFKRTWINPAPEVVITRLDFVAEHARTAPFLLALTAE